MSEHLVIRLPSHADQMVHWLIWSTSANEIIASGKLDKPDDLSELTETANGRTVKVLVPCSDLHLRKVEVDNKLKRQLTQALPYMLEEELASDVEKLHFAQLDSVSGAVYVGIVSYQQMDLWLSWLEHAGLKVRQMLPDALALPLFDNACSAIQLDDHWLVRTGFVTGLSAENDWLPLMLDPMLAATEEGGDKVLVHSFSEAPAHYVDEWVQEPAELPMQLLAQGAITSSFNLLQGEYQPSREYSAALMQWRKVAILAAVALLVSLIGKGVMIHKLSQENDLVKQEIYQVHRVLFPDVKKIRDTRIKKLVKSRLQNAQLSSQFGFLPMMKNLTPAFTKVTEFKPASINFDLKRKELRLFGSANSFQIFEKFKTNIAGNYTVEQGSLSNKAGEISGSLVIKGQ